MALGRAISSILLCAALLPGPSAVRAQTPSALPERQASSEAAVDRRLFALILRPGAAWKPGRPFREQGLAEHFRYWMGLFRQDRIATAGPLGDDSGLVLLLARDLEDAQAIMSADPAIKAGIFNGDVRPYLPPMTNPDVLVDKSKVR